MAGLADMLSQGQARTKWLNEKTGYLNEALRYYLGPTGIPDKLGALASAMQYSDAGDMVEAAGASQAMWNDPSISNLGRYATAGAALSLPIVSARGANILGDAVASAGDDARKYITDEDGGIKVWHGSPHDFDKFSMDKIGSGEGAQAYGRGLYFAESADTAKSYRDALKANNGVESTTSGRLYEVDINANPEDFLDWDAPLSEQPRKVRDALLGDSRRMEALRPKGLEGTVLEAAAKQNEGAWSDLDIIIDNDHEMYQRAMRAAKAAGVDVSNIDDFSPGEWLVNKHREFVTYRAPTDDLTRMYRGREDELRSAGVPGVKYLDQGSRGPGLDGAEGTRNYVVFDDGLLSILNKYGIFAGTPLAAFMAQQDDS